VVGMGHVDWSTLPSNAAIWEKDRSGAYILIHHLEFREASEYLDVVAFSGDGANIVGIVRNTLRTGNMLRTWDAASGRIVERDQHVPEDPHGAVFSLDGSRLAVTLPNHPDFNQPGEAILYQVSPLKELTCLPMVGRVDALSRNGDFAAGFGAEGGVHVWYTGLKLEPGMSREVAIADVNADGVWLDAGGSFLAGHPPPTCTACGFSATVLVDMKPSEALTVHREDLRQLVSRYNVAHPRVYGSVLTGKDDEGSDLDLLVDATDKTTLFTLIGLEQDAEQLLGVHVSVLTPKSLPLKFRDKVLELAEPL